MKQVTNLSSDTQDTSKEIIEYEIPSFSGDDMQKKSDIDIKIPELENFLDTVTLPNENNISELVTEDFALSINQLLANMKLQNEARQARGDGEEDSDDESYALSAVDTILANYETSSKKQTALEQVISDAEEQAKKIISEAQEDAEQIKADTRKQAYEDGYRDGFEKGSTEGRTLAAAEVKNKVEDETKQTLINIQNELEDMQSQRENIFRSQIADMRDLSIAIAEKVVNVSLKSSNDVIEKMIISATEKIKNVQWAKLYVSELDFDVNVMADVRILNAVKKVTDNVKIEIMQNKPSGTCILELPDQIIDASAQAQISEVRNLLEKG